MRYAEPVATLDADVLVALLDSHRLDLLSGTYEFCAARASQSRARLSLWARGRCSSYRHSIRSVAEGPERACRGLRRSAWPNEFVNLSVGSTAWRRRRNRIQRRRIRLAPTRDNEYVLSPVPSSGRCSVVPGLELSYRSSNRWGNGKRKGAPRSGSTALFRAYERSGMAQNGPLPRTQESPLTSPHHVRQALTGGLSFKSYS